MLWLTLCIQGKTMADFPSGIILLWHGAIVDIPAGWVICDGTLGTPNLKNRFVVASGGAYAVGATGGAFTHTHGFTSAVHNHTIPAGANIASGANIRNQSSDDVASGTTNSESSMPPYHALAYIMKL